MLNTRLNFLRSTVLLVREGYPDKRIMEQGSEHGISKRFIKLILSSYRKPYLTMTKFVLAFGVISFILIFSLCLIMAAIATPSFKDGFYFVLSLKIPDMIIYSTLLILVFGFIATFFYEKLEFIWVVELLSERGHGKESISKERPRYGLSDMETRFALSLRRRKYVFFLIMLIFLIASALLIYLLFNYGIGLLFPSLLS